MTLNMLDGEMFTSMVHLGARHLKNNAKIIDTLNVFPVPDGDTGTNMNLSMTSGVEEVRKVNSDNISEVASALAQGLLMGARGNSGVILSQIFRGFSNGIGKKDAVNTLDLSHAFDMSVKAAYKAVMKPVEGTILTVAKDAAQEAIKVAETEDDIIIMMEKILVEAKASLQRTPDLLPVLKEVGVVDSGGQGLVTIYEGFLAALKGEELPQEDVELINLEELINAEHHKIAQDFMNTEDIERGYCTEFMVKFEKEKIDESPYDEDEFRELLSEKGDSLVIVSDESVIRVHIHTEEPGEALSLGQRYGGLTNIDIENMREQHTAIIGKSDPEPEIKEMIDYGVVTVALGSGITTLFKSLGANVVIEGGQTMNPSTLDITNAIKEVNAHNVFILPNNKNIVMAAEQAAELAKVNVHVIKTATIPQGISALLAFHPESSIEDNEKMMDEAMAEVKTGQVTYAVRDTKINGIEIAKGNFMGIADSDIKATHPDKFETVKLLLQELITDEDEMLTIIHGEDVEEEEVNNLIEYIEAEYEDVELEVFDGKQPVYSYILSVE